MAGYVELKCSTHRDTLPVLPQPQLAYFLVEMIPAPASVNAQMALNVCFVLDQSGSMRDDGKIDCLRDAVQRAIDGLEPDDRVSVVAFSGTPKVIVPAQPARDKAHLKREIAKLKAGGITRMGVAMGLGLNETLKARSPDRINRLVVLTDGQTALDDESECRKVADDASREGIRISALGLGLDWNELLLADIAQQSGGEVGFIKQASEMQEHLALIVRSMHGALVQNAFLTLHLALGVTPRRIWRTAPLISDLGQRGLSDRDVQIPLGELVKGQGQGILVELVIQPCREEHLRIARAELSYDVPLMHISGEQVTGDIRLHFTANPSLPATFNAHVMNMVEKVTAFKMQTRALQEALAGDKQNATRLLRRAATLLLHQGETDLARTMELEAARLESGENLSEEGKKTIQFKANRTIQLRSGVP